jgi:hypothetical protein
MNVYRPRSMAYQTVWHVFGLDELTAHMHVSWKWISVCLTAGHSVARSSHRGRLTSGSLVKRSLCSASAERRQHSPAFVVRPRPGPAPGNVSLARRHDQGHRPRRKPAQHRELAAWPV